MDWYTQIDPAIKEIIIGAAGDGIGGLAADLVGATIGKLSRRVRGRYQEAAVVSELNETMGQALAYSLHQWEMPEADRAHLLDVLADWVQESTVQEEFKKLLHNRRDDDIDIPLLQEEFEACGLSLDESDIPFAEFVADLVAGFYIEARQKPTLQPLLSLGNLQRMAEQMGTLQKLLEQLVANSDTSLAAQERIKTLLDQFRRENSAGSETTNALLAQILDQITQLTADGESALVDKERVYSELQEARLVPDPELIPLPVKKLLCEELKASFSMSELIWFIEADLEIDREGFPENVQNDRNRLILALVDHMERRNQVARLVQKGKEARPGGNWSYEGIPQPTADPQIRQILEAIADLQLQLQSGSQTAGRDLTASEQHYREIIIDRFRKLPIKGLSPKVTPIALDLQDVYVDLNAVGQLPEGADTFSAAERRKLLEADRKGEASGYQLEVMHELDVLKAARWNEEARQNFDRLERKSIIQSLIAAKEQGLIILGDPGSGKSTLLRYVALMTAKGELKGLDGYLPIFVPLAAYDDYLTHGRHPDISLEQYLGEYYEERQQMPVARQLIADKLAQGRALVLLDGLDEVLNIDKRRFVADQVSALMSKWHGRGNRFAMTSRIVGYREAPLTQTIPHVTVLNFSWAEIETFGQQWCRAYEVWIEEKESPTVLRQAKTEADALLKDIKETPSVMRLAVNPLLLTMLALLRRNGGKLPSKRIELYRQYTNALIEPKKWMSERSGGERTRSQPGYDSDVAIHHLMRLALWLQENRPSGTARQHDLEREIGRICLEYEEIDPACATAEQMESAAQAADQFFNFMRRQSGLIVERGRDAFGFLHLTVQEYFAGRALANMNDPQARWQKIAAVLHEPRWQESIMLCLGQLGIVEQRREQISELAVSILNKGSAHEAELHRDLFFVLRMLAENLHIGQNTLGMVYERLLPHLDHQVSMVKDKMWDGMLHLMVQGHGPAERLIEVELDSESKHWHHLLVKIRRLSLQRSPTLLQPLFQALEHPNEDTRGSAVLALAGSLSEANVQHAVQKMLLDSSPKVRRWAVRAFAGKLFNLENRLLIQKMCLDSDSHVRRSAADTLAGVASDPEVRVDLRKMLFDPDSSVRSFAADALAGEVSKFDVRSDLQKMLLDSTPSIRSLAVDTLAELASDPEVQRDLQKMLLDSDPYVRRSAVSALAGEIYEPEIRSSLQKMLLDSDENVRGMAVNTLAELASDPEVQRDLQKMLLDEDWHVRDSAVQALSREVSNPEVQRGLQKMLLDSDPYVQSSAVHALAELVSDPEVRSDLQKMLLNFDSGVRDSAVRALAGFVSDAEVRGDLQKMLFDSYWDVRSSTVKTLLEFVSYSEIQLDIQKMLIDASWHVKGEIIHMMAKATPKSEVRHDLQKMLFDNHPHIRRCAVISLTGFVSEPEVRRDLQKVLLDSDPYVRHSAARSLTDAASDPEVRRDLQKMFLDSDPQVRSSAVGALTEEASRLEVRLALEKMLFDPDPQVRCSAVNALAKEISNPEVWLALQKMFLDADPKVRSSAVSALAEEVSNPEVQLMLQKMLLDHHQDVRGSVVNVLAREVSNPNVRLTLQKALLDSNYAVRCSAINALAKKLSDPEIRDELQKMLLDSDPYVRSSAVNALAGEPSNPEVRLVLQKMFLDNHERVRRSAVSALAGEVSNSEVWASLKKMLLDSDSEVRCLAVSSLAGLVSDPDIRLALQKMLFDRQGNVRAMAVFSLLDNLPLDDSLIDLLIDWTGFEVGRRFNYDYTFLCDFEALLKKIWQQLIKRDPSYLDKLRQMLTSPHAARRHRVVRIMLANDPTPADAALLAQQIDDMRDIRSWSNRLQAADILINHRDQALDQQALEITREALTFPTEPWLDFPKVTIAVRTQAAEILGKVDPLYHDEGLYQQLKEVMEQDADEGVRDKAYEALLRLASAPKQGATV